MLPPQLIDRGERFPIVFSHTRPDAAFKAPKEAFYVQASVVCLTDGWDSSPGALSPELTRRCAQLLRAGGGVGIKLGANAPAGAAAPSRIAAAPASLRDVHNILHNGPGPAPKTIDAIFPDVSARPCIGVSRSFGPLCDLCFFDSCTDSMDLTVRDPTRTRRE